MGDDSFIGVFHRNHPVVGTVAAHLVKDRGDTLLGHQLGGQPELLQCSHMGKSGLRTEKGDLKRLLQREGGRDDFPEYPLDGLVGKGAGVVPAQPLIYSQFAARHIEVLTAVGLELSDLKHDACSIVEQLEYPIVDFINVPAQLRQTIFTFFRHLITPRTKNEAENLAHLPAKSNG